MAFADLIDIVDQTARSLLDGDLIVTDAILTKITPGVRMPGAASSGTNPTSVVHACRGIVRAFDADQIDGTLVSREDRRVSLLIATLPDGVEPKPGDTIEIEGATYRVLDGVERDPAKFMFTCHGRR